MHYIYIERSSVLICFNSCIVFYCGLPKWCSGKESACQCRRCSFHPWVGKIPSRRKREPALVFLPGEFHGQRSLVGYSPWGCKESDMTEVNKHAHTCTDLGIDHFLTFSKDSLEGPYYLSCCEGRKGEKVFVCVWRKE